MAWFPGAIRKEVARHRTPMARYRGICNHVAATEAASLFNYFNQPGNPTSHFYVRRDGDVEQYVSTAYRAPAQLEGNPSLISIETQGGADAPTVNTEPWSAAQVETLAEMHAWLHKTHGIRLAVMPNSIPESTGVGYHRLGIDPWRVPDGELWSSSRGKACPGTAKIAQIPGIITRANQILNPPTTGDGTMAWTDAQITKSLDTQQKALDELLEVTQILRTHATRMDNLVNHQLPDLRGDVEAVKQVLGTTLGVDVKATRENTAAAAGMLEAIEADVDKLANPVEEPPKA